jgi:hypothetical protein
MPEHLTPTGGPWGLRQPHTAPHTHTHTYIQTFAYTHKRYKDTYLACQTRRAAWRGRSDRARQRGRHTHGTDSAAAAVYDSHAPLRPSSLCWGAAAPGKGACVRSAGKLEDGTAQQALDRSQERRAACLVRMGPQVCTRVQKGGQIGQRVLALMHTATRGGGGGGGVAAPHRMSRQHQGRGHIGLQPTVTRGSTRGIRLLRKEEKSLCVL